MDALFSGLTWVEVQSVLKEATILVPIGSNEQHGRHMPINTDSFYVTEVTKQVVENLKDEMAIFITPAVWTGYSPHHKNFPGTITLRIETFMSLIYDICESLIRHNVRRIVLINGHGGNGAPLKAVGSKIGDELGNSPLVFSYWEILGDEIRSLSFIREGPKGIPGHAGEMETSLRMFLAPDTIRREEWENSEFIITDPNPHSAEVYVYQNWKDS